jgi:hypothetical protein
MKDNADICHFDRHLKERREYDGHFFQRTCQ